MSYLLAKTKGLENEFYILLSDLDLYSLPDDIANAIEYDETILLDETEWFKIEEFSSKDYCIDILKETFISTDYNRLNGRNYKKIEYLLAYQDNIYYFQKLSKSKIIEKSYISFSGEPIFHENQKMIIIDGYPDAIYVKQDDILYFQKLSVLNSIFGGIDILYREATDAETQGFLSLSFIELNNGFDHTKVKTMNRRKIVKAHDIFHNFTENNIKEICKYIRRYCPDLDYDNRTKKFSIASDSQLKKILYGIDQRYYTTILNPENRLANSIIRIQ